MDGRDFDRLTQRLATATTRRAVVRGLAAGLLAAVGLGGTARASCPRETPVRCGDTCADLRTDPAHCGRCGQACGAGQVCYAGRCVAVCPSGFEACGGTCHRACGRGQVRLDGCACCTLATCGPNACGPRPDGCGGTLDCACANGRPCCNGACCPSVGDACCDGACVDLTTDSAHCGTCDYHCPAPQTCGGGGEPGVCGCTDDGLACGPAACGEAINNCGDTVNCGPFDGACPTGQECQGGTCACTATSCPDGCCDGSGQCRIDDDAACGTGGGACVFCPTPSNPCEVATCVDGVCGTAAGNDGRACGMGQVCRLGTCVGNGACATADRSFGCGPASCGADIQNEEARSTCLETVEGGAVCAGRAFAGTILSWPQCTASSAECPAGWVCSNDTSTGRWCVPICDVRA